MEELLVVGVLHLAHPAELIHPKGDLMVGLWHSPFMPSAQPKDNLARGSQMVAKEKPAKGRGLHLDEGVSGFDKIT